MRPVPHASTWRPAHLERRGMMESENTTRQKTTGKDPVCGMAVDPTAARGGSFEHNGSTYYFCNPKCNQRLQAGPAKYLDPNYKPGVHAMGSAMVQLGTKPVTLQGQGLSSAETVPAPLVQLHSASGHRHTHHGQ